MKKIGFTLAEVLITLGIIGVVAALTIPTLIKNYQEKIFISKVKQAYSILTNAQKMSTLENYDIQTWKNDYKYGTTYYNYNKANFEKYYMPYFKIEKYCGNNSTKKCFSDEACFNENCSDKLNTNFNHTKALLKNGMSISFAGLSFPLEKSVAPTIILDINGYDGPNEWGKDLFYLRISTNGNITSYNCDPINTYYTHKGNCIEWVLKKNNMDYLKW